MAAEVVNTSLSRFCPYVNRLEKLLHLTLFFAHSEGLKKSHHNALSTSLDGEPGRELRKAIDLSRLRREGIFFTGSKLARLAANELLVERDDDAVIGDFACGAGDLLVSCARKLSRRETLTD